MQLFVLFDICNLNRINPLDTKVLTEQKTLCIVHTVIYTMPYVITTKIFKIDQLVS